jgi:hypothetical protein
MLRGPVAAALSILSFLSTAGLAQTTMPATTQAGLDQSTPRGALKLFFECKARSDGDGMRQILLPSSPAQEQIVAALADQNNAARDLSQALETRFPQDGPTPSELAERQLPPVFEKIDQSKLTIDGDDATLISPNPDAKPFMFHRKDGKWRIPLSALLTDVDSAKLMKQAHQIEVQVVVMRAGAADVNAGKFTSASEAIEDLKKQMYDAAMADRTAASTTNP